nr:hypothetical protein [Williamsia phyllosphaerae]
MTHEDGVEHRSWIHVDQPQPCIESGSGGHERTSEHSEQHARLIYPVSPLPSVELAQRRVAVMPDRQFAVQEGDLVSRAQLKPQVQVDDLREIGPESADSERGVPPEHHARRFADPVAEQTGEHVLADEMVCVVAGVQFSEAVMQRATPAEKVLVLGHHVAGREGECHVIAFCEGLGQRAQRLWQEFIVAVKKLDEFAARHLDAAIVVARHAESGVVDHDPVARTHHLARDRGAVVAGRIVDDEDLVIVVILCESATKTALDRIRVLVERNADGHRYRFTHCKRTLPI